MSTIASNADRPKLTNELRPAKEAVEQRPYSTPSWNGPIDLWLDGTESLANPLRGDEFPELADSVLLQRYPNAKSLEQQLARDWDLPPECVLATAGADDALDRCCRAMLGPDRKMILPVPTFEMLARFAKVAGGRILHVDWTDDRFPTSEIVECIDETVGLIPVVSPNNPTGRTARVDDVLQLSRAAPHALIVVDLAYGDFADEDLTQKVLGPDNVVVVRSLSKSWGLAGLRVGYALGPSKVIQWLRSAGGPYPISALSLAVTERCLATGRSQYESFVHQSRKERRRLTELFETQGSRCTPSQANFVFVEVANAAWIRAALASLGISVRMFASGKDLENRLRISCPGDESAFERLERGLACAIAPQGMLFDMDGVIADVSQSYRQAILETAASFGAAIDRTDVAEAKEKPDSNNDWVVAHRLLEQRGIQVSLEEVTRRFEAIYQGTDSRQGLRLTERRLVDREWLQRLSTRFPLGIVTGRPRKDAERFLMENDIAEFFSAVVCMEDADLKPSPAPVRLALSKLNIASAWLVGDSVDDITASRLAGVVSIGVVAPGADPQKAKAALSRAGAATVLTQIQQLEDLLS